MKGANGESSLHIAASNLNRNIVRYLIDQEIVNPNCLGIDRNPFDLNLVSVSFGSLKDNFERNAIHTIIIKSISRKFEPKKVLSMVKLLNKYGKEQFLFF